MQNDLVEKTAIVMKKALKIHVEFLRPDGTLPEDIDPWYPLLFQVNNSLTKLCHEVSQYEQIGIISNSIHHIWAGIPIIKFGTLQTILVLGPVTYSNISENYIADYLIRANITLKLKRPAVDLLQSIPVIPSSEFMHYIQLFNHLAGGYDVAIKNIKFLSSQENSLSPIDKWKSMRHWMIDDYHGTYEAEQAILKAVEKGGWEMASAVSVSGNWGIICPFDPLRQKKNEVIVSITLVICAIITGGVNSASAFNLSDYYIQKTELAKSFVSLESILSSYSKDCQRLSKLSQNNKEYSKPVAICLQYVADHIYEKIQIENITVIFGYNTYYLTYLFKKEIGMTLNEYIHIQKIETAKDFLIHSNHSLVEISEMLHFCTPSYFGKQFKKIIGMTPKQYRLKNNA